MKPSMKEQYELYSKYVPEISSDDLNFFNNKINTIVHQIIIKQRTSIMMRLVKLPYPSPPLPPKDKLYDSLQEVSPDNFLEVSPQQVQSITILINHLYKNPQTFAEAIKAQQDIPNNDCFLLFNTSIPAIYGFFSSWELNYYASSFYCALIDISPRHIAREALIPYYCSPCTHRFIESIYNIFGKQFCHDIRYNSPKPQPLIIERYLSLFINSINKSFPFLPQSHQFILKFMGTRGWTSRSIIDFFVNRFTLPQLLQYVKSTAFKNHYKQLLQFSTLIKCDDDNFKSIISVINNSKSIFQIPSCFSDFDFPYFDILITKLDISLIIESLKLIKEGIPKNLQPFLKPTQYFQSINFRPFFIRVYIKSPIQSDILLNVRNVIFNEPINIYEKITNNEFKRRFRQIKDKANRISVSPITFIKMNTKIFGRKITKEFEDFIYYELIEELEKNADIFEKYLLHLMAFKSVFNWKLIVHKYCKIILKPYAEKEIKKFLTWSNRNKKNLAKLTEKMTICKNTQFSLIVQHLLPSFLTKNIIKKLQIIENLWKSLVLNLHQEIKIPDLFKTNKIMKMKLWETIEHIKSVMFVSFGYIVNIILEAMEEICMYNDENPDQDLLVQYIIVLSDCPNLISLFMLSNCLIIKRKEYVYLRSEKKVVLWSIFERAFLKLISTNEELLSAFLDLQDSLLK